jgi:hypothetical protein
VSFVFKTSTTPTCVLSIEYKRNGFTPCWFGSVVSPYMPQFGATITTPFWSLVPFLVKEFGRLWSPWRNLHLEHYWWHPILLWFGPWTWPFHGSMLWFPLLHHKCLEGVKESKKLLGHFVHLWIFVFSCLGKLVHSWTF